VEFVYLGAIWSVFEVSQHRPTQKGGVGAVIYCVVYTGCTAGGFVVLFFLTSIFPAGPAGYPAGVVEPGQQATRLVVVAGQQATGDSKNRVRQNMPHFDSRLKAVNSLGPAHFERKKEGVAGVPAFFCGRSISDQGWSERSAARMA